MSKSTGSERCRFYVETHGSGGPTVILEAGSLGRSDVWSRDLTEPPGERTMVLPAVAEMTHVSTYDRPGTIGEVNSSLEPSGPLFYPSRSDPVPQPRTIADIAADLHALLGALKITEAQAEHVFKDIEAKRKTTRYLHLKPVLVEPVTELKL